MNAVWDRKEPRVAFQTNVRLIPPDESSAVDGQTANLSESGLFVTTEAPLEPRSHVLCQLALPGRRLTVRGRVVWVQRAEDQSLQGAGIEFVELSTLDRQLLRQAVGDHEASELAEASHDGDISALNAPGSQRAVTVWFEGMAVPVRAQARMTEHGLRLRTALPFLRRDSSVGFVMSEEQDPRPGVLRRVVLEATSPIPELDIEVALADLADLADQTPVEVEEQPLKAISSADSTAADGEIAAAEAQLHADLEAELFSEDEGVTLAQMRGDMPVEPSVEIDLGELELDDDGYVEARADADHDGYEDDGSSADDARDQGDQGYEDDGYDEDDELALRDEQPTDPVGAPPSHVLEAARRDEHLDASPREIVATPTGPAAASLFDTADESQVETLMLSAEDKAEGSFWDEAERRRRRFWLWMAALAMSGIAVASLVKTRFWDNVSTNVGKYFEKPKIVFNPAATPASKKARPAEPKVGAQPPSALPSPSSADVAPPSSTSGKATRGPRRPSGAKPSSPSKLRAGIPLPGDNADKAQAAGIGSKPVVLYERGAIVVRLPVRGTAKDLVQYELDQPRGVSINLPHAKAALALKVYRVKKHGVRKVWVRERKGGIQVRVFYKKEMRPRAKVEGGVLEIRLARR